MDFKRNILPSVIFGSRSLLDLWGGVSDASSYEAAGEYNSDMAMRDAKLIRESSALDIRSFDKQARKLKGTQRAVAAKQNTPLSGSIIDVLADTATELELEKATMKWKSEIQAQAKEDEAKYYKWYGRRNARRTYLAASGRLMSGLGDYMRLF